MDSFDLAGLDAACALPSQEEQAAKEADALDKVRHFIVSHGGTWEDGWTCRMRFRVTTRRNGKMGRTTDNYYYTPCGRCFRNYKQIGEFMGLRTDDGVRGKPGPKAAKRPADAAGPSNDSWRSTSTAPGTALAATGAAVPSTGAGMATTAAATVMAPATASPSDSGASSGGANSNSRGTDDTARSASPAPPSAAQPPVKKARTKAALAALRAGAAAAPLPRLLPLAGIAGTVEPLCNR